MGYSVDSVPQKVLILTEDISGLTLSVATRASVGILFIVAEKRNGTSTDHGPRWRRQCCRVWFVATDISALGQTERGL